MALEAGAIRTQDLYGLDDEQFSASFNAGVFPSFALIENTRHRVLHKQVLRLQFSDDKPAHRRIEDIPARLSLEREIAAEAGRVLGRTVDAESIIVDVPERLSFDVQIPVVDPSQADSEEAETAGPESPLHGLGYVDFPRSLRSISVSARRDPDLLAVLARMDLARRFAS
jgi:hypothetical protein